MSEKFVDFSLEITAPPNWFCSVTPATLSVAQGKTATFTVKATAQGGYTGSIALQIDGLPAGVVPVFTPPTIAQDGSSTVEIPTDILSISTHALKLHGTATP